MLTKEEAGNFLATHLNISNEELNQEKKLQLLNRIISSYHKTIPFQNLGLLSKEPSTRHKPTLEEVKDNVLKGKRGLCYINNVFMCYLLKSIGYEAQFGIASVACKNNHIIVLVSSVESSGDLYLVEVGCGYPTFQAIPLNFETESPTYTDSFLEYKFIKKDGRIWRMHKRGDLRPGGPSVPSQDIINGCRRFYDFSLETQPLQYYDKYMEEVYSNPGMSPFHKSLRIIYFKEGNTFGFKDKTLLEENSRHELVGTQLENLDILNSIISKKCLQFSKDTVEKATSNWMKQNFS